VIDPSCSSRPASKGGSFPLSGFDRKSANSVGPSENTLWTQWNDPGPAFNSRLCRGGKPSAFVRDRASMGNSGVVSALCVLPTGGSPPIQTTAPSGCDIARDAETARLEGHSSEVTALCVAGRTPVRNQRPGERTVLRDATNPLRRLERKRRGFAAMSLMRLHMYASFPSCIRGFDSLRPLHGV